jgi:hypothetical protein
LLDFFWFVFLFIVFGHVYLRCCCDGAFHFTVLVTRPIGKIEVTPFAARSAVLSFSFSSRRMSWCAVAQPLSPDHTVGAPNNRTRAEAMVAVICFFIRFLLELLKYE